MVSIGLAKKSHRVCRLPLTWSLQASQKNSPRVCRLPLTWSLQAWQKTLHVSVDFLRRGLYRLGKKLSTCLSTSFDVVSTGLAKKLSTCLSTSFDVVLYRLGKKTLHVSVDFSSTWSLQAWQKNPPRVCRLPLTWSLQAWQKTLHVSVVFPCRGLYRLGKKLSTCLSTSFDVVSTGLAKNSPRVCRLPLTWSLQACQKNSPRVCRLPLTWSLQAWQKKLSTCLSTSFDVVSTCLAKNSPRVCRLPLTWSLQACQKNSPRVCRLPLTWSLQAWQKSLHVSVDFL